MRFSKKVRAKNGIKMTVALVANSLGVQLEYQISGQEKENFSVSIGKGDVLLFNGREQFGDALHDSEREVLREAALDLIEETGAVSKKEIKKRKAQND